MLADSEEAQICMLRALYDLWSTHHQVTFYAKNSSSTGNILHLHISGKIVSLFQPNVRLPPTYNKLFLFPTSWQSLLLFEDWDLNS